MMEEWWNKYQVSVPEGKDGKWRVERFEVDEKGARFHNMRAAMHGGRRTIMPGYYTKLMCDGCLVMSDTPAEISDHLDPIREARERGGHCLIHGLGLGVVVQGVLNNSNVERVTVVELSLEVARLVGPHYKEMFGERLSIVEGNAFTWKPPKGVRYSVVWHDVWNDLCADNLVEMHKLHRRFGRRCDWQGSWGRELLERESRRSYY